MLGLNMQRLLCQLNFYNKYKNYVKKSYKIKGEFDGDIHKFYKENKNVLVRGGRENALKILDESKINKIYFLDNLYEKIGITSVILFVGNTIISGKIGRAHV
mgnify:CR=1 FL=1